MRGEPRAEGRRWLEQAEADLGWSRHLLEQGAYYLVCFLAQQTAGKALKAFLYAQGEELVVGDSVRQLTERAAAYGEGFAARLESWAILDAYYIPTRYPNGLPDSIPARVFNLQAAEGALELAEQAVAEVSRWFADTEGPR
ncbi:MAG: HEPN domain-containing protein [Anaerolineae bacterium]|nr:HEPN domain-containing protein [Anaerolineae bacterium]